MEQLLAQDAFSLLIAPGAAVLSLVAQQAAEQEVPQALALPTAPGAASVLDELLQPTRRAAKEMAAIESAVFIR